MNDEDQSATEIPVLIEGTCVVCGVKVLADINTEGDDFLCEKHWFSEGDE